MELPCCVLVRAACRDWRMTFPRGWCYILMGVGNVRMCGLWFKGDSNRRHSVMFGCDKGLASEPRDGGAKSLKTWT